jgi:hypothetical protein
MAFISIHHRDTEDTEEAQRVKLNLGHYLFGMLVESSESIAQRRELAHRCKTKLNASALIERQKGL